MPIRLAVPLPGPFVYMRRSADALPKTRFERASYWLFGVFLLELGWWGLWIVAAVTVYLVKALVVLTAAVTLAVLVIRDRRRQPSGRHLKSR